MPRFERFAVLQDGYDIEKVASGPEPEDGFFTRKTGWVYKRLKKYVETE
jgi:hypothetical protein